MYLTVNTLATIYLPEDTRSASGRSWPHGPEIDVRNGSEARLRVDDRTFPLVIAPGYTPGLSDTKLLAELVGPDKVLLVVSERLAAECAPRIGICGIFLRRWNRWSALASTRSDRPPGAAPCAGREHGGCPTRTWGRGGEGDSRDLGGPEREWPSPSLRRRRPSRWQAHNVLSRLQREA